MPSRPLHRMKISTLLVAGYAVIFVVVTSLGWLATENMRQLRAITQDLYAHAFVVSNAAANLKASLFQLRNQIIGVAVLRSKDSNDDLERIELEARAFSESSRNGLAVIKANFLGDMQRVNELEAELDQWDAIRAEILAANRRGDFETAEHMVRASGTPKFNEIAPLVDYVLTYTRNEAGQFVDSADNHSGQIIARTYWLITLLMFFIAVTAITVFLRVRHLQNELSRQATIDFLTGIPNRQYFMAMADQEASISKRYGNPLAVAVCDLDWFKKINDTYGHHVGDAVLKKFSEICRNTLRHADIFGRIGGEEFAILLPNTPILEANEVIDRVRKAVEESTLPLEGQATPVRFTVSFGLTAYSPEITDISSIFQIADEALYKAKESGRNRVCVFEPCSAEPENPPASTGH